MVWTKDEILKILEQEKTVLRQYGIRRLGLFGSYARGEVTDQSDLDFVVEFERKTFGAYMDLREFLEKRFNCPVDLVIADAVKPALRHPIIDQAIYATGS